MTSPWITGGINSPIRGRLRLGREPKSGGFCGKSLDWGTAKSSGISRNDRLAAGYAGSSRGHAIFEVREFQGEGFADNRFVDGGDIEHAQDFRDQVNGLRCAEFFPNEVVKRCNRVGGEQSLGSP